MKYKEILKHTDSIEDFMANKIDINDFDKYFPDIVKRLYRRHVNARLPHDNNKTFREIHKETI